MLASKLVRLVSVYFPELLRLPSKQSVEASQLLQQQELNRKQINPEFQVPQWGSYNHENRSIDRNSAATYT